MKKAPKRIRPLCGASFGFCGKLVSFGHETSGGASPQVHISQVIIEEELAIRSKGLENALHPGNLAEFCMKKPMSSSEHKEAWDFLVANFSPAPRQQLLQLLDYELEQNTEYIY